MTDGAGFTLTNDELVLEIYPDLFSYFKVHPLSGVSGSRLTITVKPRWNIPK